MDAVTCFHPCKVAVPKLPCVCILIASLFCVGCRARDAHPGTVPAYSSNSQPAPREPLTTSGVAIGVSSGFGKPELDLPADRLHERVNGAAPTLRKMGCRRLLGWRLEPELELEVLVFDAASGAKQALDKDTESARTHPVPGDEGWTNAQVVYFRRGAHYCRLIAENRGHEQALLQQAERVDRAILSGDLIH